MAERDRRYPQSRCSDQDSVSRPRRPRRPPRRSGGQPPAARAGPFAQRAPHARGPLPRAVQRPGQRRGLPAGSGLGASSVIVASVLLVSRLNLDPGSWISWIIVGLISGAIAARVVAGRGFGCIADIVVGVAGAIIGGYLLGALFNAGGTVGFWGSIVVAFIGAAVLLSVLKLLSGGRL